MSGYLIPSEFGLVFSSYFFFPGSVRGKNSNELLTEDTWKKIYHRDLYIYIDR